MDKALFALFLPLIFGVLILAWLFYASAGGRRIDLKIKGLGISIDLDTSPGQSVDATSQGFNQQPSTKE